MTDTSFRVEKVLKTYGRQLGRSRRALQNSSASNKQSSDSVHISPRGRRLHTLGWIAAEISRNPAEGNDPKAILNEAVARLSLEHGEPLAIVTDPNSGMGFAVVDPDSGMIQHHLPEEDSNHLAGRLSEIVRDYFSSTQLERRRRHES